MRRIVLASLVLSLMWPAASLEAQLPSREEETPAPQSSLGEKVHQGNLLFLKGDLAGALGHYQDALGKASEAAQVKIHYNLANTLTRLGRFEEAEKQYQKALRIDSKSEDAKYNLEATYLLEEGKDILLRPQAELAGASEQQLQEEILQILQLLEQQEFGFPKGTPQPPTQPQRPPEKKRKDW